MAESVGGSAGNACTAGAELAAVCIAVKLVAESRLARGPAIDTVDVIDVVVIVVPPRYVPPWPLPSPEKPVSALFSYSRPKVQGPIM